MFDTAGLLPYKPYIILCIYHIAGKFGREKFYEFAVSEHLVEKVWRMNRSANRLSIVTTNSDGFGLANHGRFANFAKLSSRQIFPLYGSCEHV